MTSLVVDASAMFKCLVCEEWSREAVSILQRAEGLTAPDLLYAECANAIWKRVRRGLLVGSDADDLVAQLRAYPLQALPLGDLTADALRISLAFDHPIYGCYYVAAAIQSGHTLVTADRVLAKLARDVGLEERVVLLGEERS
ncbi:MAG: PIN domain-containing protein [Actinobacteria bacterium]|nr:MAG: PIN domain-containing protein [Actinomycetota bacterium]